MSSSLTYGEANHRLQDTTTPKLLSPSHVFRVVTLSGMHEVKTDPGPPPSSLDIFPFTKRLTPAVALCFAALFPVFCTIFRIISQLVG